MISVLMSVYNDENNVKLAIESILHQSYQDFEFLIMDDCSSDNTFEICKDYSKLDARINVYQNDNNLGLTKSLNKLLGFAKRDFIARQDSDDISLSDRFIKQINFISENNLKYKTYITQELLKKNILAANLVYVSVAHKKDDIDRYFFEFEKVIKTIKSFEDGLDPDKFIENKIANKSFKRLN